MADRQHLSLLLESIELFNRWRADDPARYPDLSSADLVRTDLTGANLTGADLSRADLFEAVMVGTNLVGANLTGANLTRANLFGANMEGSDLAEAILNATNLRRAYRAGANLTGVGLRKAQLLEATAKALAALVKEGLLGDNDDGYWLLLHDGGSLNEGIRLVADTMGTTENSVRAIIARTIEERDLLPPRSDLESPSKVEDMVLLGGAKPLQGLRAIGTPPVLRISVDIGPGVRPTELAMHVSVLADVGTLIEALLPAFMDPSPARGEATESHAAETDDSDVSPYLVVHAMSYENPLAVDLAFALPPGAAMAAGAAGVVGTALKYQEQLRKTVDWVVGHKERRVVYAAEADANVSEAQARAARAKVDEARAQAELAALQKDSGGLLEALPAAAAVTLRLVVDNQIDIETLEP